MIVADVVKLLEMDLKQGRRWFQTQYTALRTEEIIDQLEKVDQNLPVLSFQRDLKRIVPEVFILVDGVKRD